MRLRTRVRFLEMRLSVGQMTKPRRIPTTDRAFLEMTLQNITARECVTAKYAHVWTVTSMSEQMALEMFAMQISFVTVRTSIFSVGIFDGDYRTLGGPSSSSGHWETSRSTGKNTSTTLRTYDMSWRFFSKYLLKHIALGVS
jgi:hypothetical protein